MTTEKTEATEKTPKDYGLPHSQWRPNQQKTIEALLGKPEGKTTILSAPTGSGKTAYFRAMAQVVGATGLVRTKLLQQKNYGEAYSADILYGKGNYPCIHPDVTSEDHYASASDCLYEGAMEDCEYARECPFLVQREKVQKSKIRSLNNALYLSSPWTKAKRFGTDYLFIDEAHLLSDEVVEWIGVTIREIDRIKYDLPNFPACYQSNKGNIDLILSWMEHANLIVAIKLADIKGDDPETKLKRAKLKRFGEKISVTFNAIQANSNDWYARSGGQALEYMGTMRSGLMVKPLTAKYHFPKLFLSDAYKRFALMSATIGNPQVFAGELGLTDYDYESIPNSFPVESRPVHVLPCPVLGYKSPPSYFSKQAELIKGAIEALPLDWSGIIHTTSYKQAQNLSQCLRQANFDASRLFVPPSGGGTNGQMDQWNYVKSKNKRKGMIIIIPTFSEGVDLLQERICIIAKTPWPYAAPGTFEKERADYNSDMYKLRTAWSIEQRAGRTRRGRPEDYDTAGKVNGYVAIVDGSFRKMGLKKYCSDDFRESLIWD